MDDQMIAAVKSSYGRCLNDPDFFGKFYNLFLDSHPEVKPKFANTDFAKQKQVIQHGVNMMIAFAGGNPVATSVINRIRDSHCETEMNIPTKLYSYWLNSLMKVVAQADLDFNDDLDKAWREVMQLGIDHVISGHSRAKQA